MKYINKYAYFLSIYNIYIYKTKNMKVYKKWVKLSKFHKSLKRLTNFLS